MIGDREQDIIGALENGISGFGVLWGYGTKDELENSGAHAFLNTPRDLVTVFENKKSAIETITPTLDNDGEWRVSGYFIK
jgi:phosphoglycolate phosphatase